MLILLDIDGVMVPANGWKRPEFLSDGFAMFGAKAINALKRIIEETGAEIVLTTSHKSNYNIQEWLKIFRLRGISIDKIRTLPGNYNNVTRKEELLQWYDLDPKNRSEPFVIIDDDNSLNALPSYLKNRLILTSGTVGLTDELANKAINILESDSNYHVKHG